MVGIYKKIIFKLLLTGMTVTTCLFLGEGFCRLMFEPVDYLKPVLVESEFLGWTVKEHSAGHDAWGYRNNSVPDRVDVVAIGDSQTYGVAADASHDWPSDLQRKIGKRVYNLALGGFGPVQYAYLLEEKALSLKPSTVIVGLYFGNDLFDAWSIAYTKPYWYDLRDPELITRFDVQSAPSRVLTSKHGAGSVTRVRDWLASNSILYRRVDFSSFGQLMHVVEGLIHAEQEGMLNHFFAEVGGQMIEFAPAARYSAMNLAEKNIEEGLRITLERIEHMNTVCAKHDVNFIVTLIPTKESVYGEWLAVQSDEYKADLARRMLAAEDEVRQQVMKVFTEQDIFYIDLLPVLQKYAGKGNLYPFHNNGHPNKLGYQVIADRLAEEFMM